MCYPPVFGVYKNRHSHSPTTGEATVSLAGLEKTVSGSIIKKEVYL